MAVRGASGVSGGAVIVMQNRFLRRFRDAGATAPERAATLDELGCRSTFVFRRMVDRGVFVASGEERFHLDEQAAVEFLQRRRRMVLLFMLFGIIAAIIAGIVSSKG